MKILKILYGWFLSLLTIIGGLSLAKRFDSYFRFKRKLDLKNPKTLADKICYIEIYKRSSFTSKCTDKYEVRNYIISKGLGDILVPLCGGPYNDVEDIDFMKLPNKFVLKGTHGCKMNIIVDNKNTLNITKTKQIMKKWLKTSYGKYSIEPHYLDIPHRIYIEKYLGKQDKLIDYKFYCLNGVPSFVNVSSDRHSDGDNAMVVTQELYDMNWNPIFEVKQNGFEVPGTGNIKKPKKFDQMIEIAKILSSDFDFVRVDLYNIGDKVYFGELTFTPFAGVLAIYTDDFIKKWGKNLKIEIDS